MDRRDRPPEVGVDLRARLCDMRAELVGKLEQRIDGGMLALLGTVHGAISAVDSAPGEAVAAARAVVADDGEVIRLTFYAADGGACGLDLAPAHAVRPRRLADRGGFDQATLSAVRAQMGPRPPLSMG